MKVIFYSFFAAFWRVSKEENVTKFDAKTTFSYLHVVLLKDLLRPHVRPNNYQGSKTASRLIYILFYEIHNNSSAVGNLFFVMIITHLFDFSKLVINSVTTTEDILCSFAKLVAGGIRR